MTTSVERGSAKIYQFPATKRRLATGRFDGPNVAATISTISSPSVAPTEFGSGWYHDEAIADDQTRKN